MVGVYVRMDVDMEKNPSELAYLVTEILRIKASGGQVDRARTRMRSGKGAILPVFETRS